MPTSTTAIIGAGIDRGHDCAFGLRAVATATNQRVRFILAFEWEFWRHPWTKPVLPRQRFNDRMTGCAGEKTPSGQLLPRFRRPILKPQATIRWLAWPPSGRLPPHRAPWVYDMQGKRVEKAMRRLTAALFSIAALAAFGRIQLDASEITFEGATTAGEDISSKSTAGEGMSVKQAERLSLPDAFVFDPAVRV